MNKNIIIKILRVVDRLLLGPGEIRSGSDMRPDVRNILIVEIWGVGDLVMMTSVVGPLRRRYPAAKITLLAKPAARELFSENDGIDEIIPFDFPWTAFAGKYRLWRWNWKGLGEVIRKLKDKQFDLSVDARGDARNHFIVRRAGVKRSVGMSYFGGGFLLTDPIAFDLERHHRVEAWKEILNYLGADTQTGPILRIGETEKQRAREFLTGQGSLSLRPVIGIHPGARIPVRRWPVDKFIRIGSAFAKKYGVKLLVFVDPEGSGDAFPEEGPFIKIRASLREMAVLFSQLDLLICNDGGPMHAASAAGARVCAVFGPTDPVRFRPYDTIHRLVIHEPMPCRPCFDRCRFKRPFCILDIEENEILKMLDEMIREILYNQ